MFFVKIQVNDNFPSHVGTNGTVQTNTQATQCRSIFSISSNLLYQRRRTRVKHLSLRDNPNWFVLFCTPKTKSMRSNFITYNTFIQSCTSR